MTNLPNIFLYFAKRTDRLGKAITVRSGSRYTDVTVYISGWMLGIELGKPTYWVQAGYSLLSFEAYDLGFALVGTPKDILEYNEHNHPVSAFSLRDGGPEAINCVRSAQRILAASGIQSTGRTPDDLISSIREGLRSKRISGIELARTDGRSQDD